jgi:hypothetical protein
MAGGLSRSTVGSLVALAIIAGGYLGVTKIQGRAASPVAPAAAEGAEAARRELVVHATGDVMLDPTQLGLLAASPTAPWTAVRHMFGADDVTIVNLECGPGAGGERQDKQYTFRCSDPQAQAAMRAAGIEVTNMGNNHSGDFGIAAMLEGRARLVRAGLQPVGAGRNAAQAESPALFERAGRTIAVLGFSRVVPVATWRAKADRAGVADGYVIPTMVRAVRAAKASADLVFVTIHWGTKVRRSRSQKTSRAPTRWSTPAPTPCSDIMRTGCSRCGSTRAARSSSDSATSSGRATDRRQSRKCVSRRVARFGRA